MPTSRPARLFCAQCGRETGFELAVCPGCGAPNVFRDLRRYPPPPQVLGGGSGEVQAPPGRTVEGAGRAAGNGGPLAVRPGEEPRGTGRPVAAPEGEAYEAESTEGLVDEPTEGLPDEGTEDLDDDATLAMQGRGRDADDAVAALVRRSEADGPQSFLLRPGETSVGRPRKDGGDAGPGALRIEHRTVSRRHGTFEVTPDGVVRYRDAGSRNGSRLRRGGDVRELDAASSHRLEDGDEIEFGEVRYLLRLREDTARGASGEEGPAPDATVPDDGTLPGGRGGASR